MKSYVSKNSEYLNRQRNIIRKQFRNIFINSVQQYTQYKFYKIGFSKISLDEFVNRNFKILNGKCFSVSLLEDKFTLIIAIHNLDINFKKFIEEQIDNLNDYTYKFGDDDFNAKEMPKEPIIPLEMPSIAAEEESKYNK